MTKKKRFVCRTQSLLFLRLKTVEMWECLESSRGIMSLTTMKQTKEGDCDEKYMETKADRRQKFL